MSVNVAVIHSPVWLNIIPPWCLPKYSNPINENSIYVQNRTKTVLFGLKATFSRVTPTSSFTGSLSHPSGMGSLCILGCYHNMHTITSHVIVSALHHTRCTESIGYLSFAIQVGLAERLNGLSIQTVGGQVIGQMVCQVNQSDERSLKSSHSEILHHSAVTGLVHIHHHKQNLHSHQHKQ